ncbi:class I SAM-dependent methyltransferase [uncultured Ornithinimicrobium sp.]|uniref:class I SAM-dependent methyltransferase n=1 Tax=uncultured Ornithinimicrobium sp. TaxID=259307 RepID=UPI002596F4BE|nr:methyltransferase domain-containing protein [uncultured Ornithinimicrobium sp.]
MTYDDPRLAVVYDIDNPDGPDHDFFRRFADHLGAKRIVDLGCGTGLLTVTLTAPGRTVTGIDPAAAMLDRATARPGGEAVNWVLGTGEQIAPQSADLVLMSGNVAMHILGDDWHTTLAAIARGLRPGGRLVFESRNPQARAWETWNDPVAERDTPIGLLRESLTTEPPGENGIVVMHCHNEFVDTGHIADVEQTLQFRTRQQIVDDLLAAGLVALNVWRGWALTPFVGTQAEQLKVFEAAPA